MNYLPIYMAKDYVSHNYEYRVVIQSIKKLNYLHNIPRELILTELLTVVLFYFIKFAYSGFTLNNIILIY